jgi:MtN3 and saliva related transmembrane protein
MMIIGWASSLILLLTIGTQIRRQWQRGSSEGVSPWMFFGQIFASIGFVIYSAIQHDWVFIVTNSLLLVSAIIGFAITVHQKRRAAAANGPSPTAERSGRALGYPGTAT